MQAETSPAIPGIVVTIDGPAGAGKSTVARLLAEHLGFEFLDTGAMYRCVTLEVLRRGISASDEQAVQEMANSLQIEMDGQVVRLNGEDVSKDIRAPDVSSAIGTIANNVPVRKLLSQLQRDWASGRCVVTEGRDQGSEVFQDAACKFFLQADNHERARRRMKELSDGGIHLDFATVLAQQERRDQEDKSRPVGGLRQAQDAIEVRTDGQSLEEVVDQLRRLIEQRLGNSLLQACKELRQSSKRLVGERQS